MTFEFATAGRILFGRGTSRQVPALARDLGRRALVVLGGSGRGREALTAGLGDADVRPVVFNVGGEPTTHLVDEATRIARAEGCDLVIALGGGSVIDAGKAVAGMLANPGEVLDYLELVGGRQAAARARRAVRRRPHHGGHGRRGDPQRRARRPRARGEGEPAEPPPAGPPGRRRPRAHPVAPARDHGLHRHGRADAADRAVRRQRRQPARRRRLPRGARAGGTVAGGRLSRRVRPRGPRGHGAGRPLRRDRPGERPARRGARVRRRPGRGHRPAARRPLRPAPARSSWRPTSARSASGATRPSCGATSRSPGP